MASAADAAEPSREGGGASLSEGIVLGRASSDKTDLTYADPPKPTRPAVKKPVANSTGTPVAVAQGPQDADMSLNALVTADRSASTSSSFSRDYVEQWRATVEVSADELSFESEVLSDKTPRAAVRLTQTMSHRAEGEGSSRSSPVSKRSQPAAGLGDRTGVQRNQKSGTRRMVSSTDSEPVRGAHDVRQTGSRAAAAQSSRSALRKEAPGAPAVPEIPKRVQEFGRDRTNTVADTSDSSDAESSKSTPRKVSVPKRGQAVKGRKDKDPSDAAEGPLEAEKRRKEQARAKWKEIDDFQLDTVYTL